MAEITKLESIEALDVAFADSHDRTVVLFKHSLICPVSRRAFEVFQNFVEGMEEDAESRFQLIEIQRQRSLSREVAQRTEVRHESPQALVLRNGRVTWHDSHGQITAAALASALGG